MKNVFFGLVVALLFAGTQAFAQSNNVYKLEVPEVSAANPNTTVIVSVTIEKESIKKGPYARFAQKYLGAVAPLTDKDIFTVKSAGISYENPFQASWDAQPAVFPGSLAAQQPIVSTGLQGVSVDRQSIVEKSQEDMARDAANTIYSIRKRRFDLVSGEIGENVYGAGLEAAITELNLMEREYMALFMGSQSVTSQVKTFEIVPQADKTTYIVCRFSTDKGILPDSDLSGTPIVLTLVPENGVKVPQAAKGGKAFDYYRVADYVQCTLAGPTGELAKARIPIYQFGQTVAVATNAVK